MKSLNNMFEMVDVWSTGVSHYSSAKGIDEKIYSQQQDMHLFQALDSSWAGEYDVSCVLGPLQPTCSP